MKFIILSLLFSSLSFASTTKGSLKSFKPGEYSSIIRNEIFGESAKLFYNHLNVTVEDDNYHKVRIKKSKNLECIDYYSAEEPYFVCYFHLNESGDIGAGY